MHSEALDSSHTTGNTSKERDNLNGSHPKDGVFVRPHAIEYARSQLDNWNPPLPILDEVKVLQEFKGEWRRQTGALAQQPGKQLMYIDVEEFEIFRLGTQCRSHDYELCPLHQMVNLSSGKLCLSGVAVSHGGRRHYIDSIELSKYSVGGYDTEDDHEDNPDTIIYVQSQTAEKLKDFDVWYLLTVKPANWYRHYHEAFLWVASFGKHVIDCLSIQPESSVDLSYFKQEFHGWLSHRYPNNTSYAVWQHRYGRTEFQVAFHAYVDFIYNQANNLPNEQHLLSHPVWGTCNLGTRIKKHPEKYQKTIATPTVYNCFKKMYFGECLQETTLCDEVRQCQEARMKLLGFATDSSSPQVSKGDHGQAISASQPTRPFTVGDIIGVASDKTSGWSSKDDIWLAYVQRTDFEGNNQRLYVLWLYRPHDTTISTMVYPHEKEIFFSDNCNCDPKEGALYSTDVLFTYSLEYWPNDINTSKDLFVRSKYVTRESAFIALKNSDFQCACRKPIRDHRAEISRGDTVYMSKTKNHRQILEPVIVETRDMATNEFTVRRLLRLERDCQIIAYDDRYVSRRHLAPNELVWTDEFLTIPAKRIQRKCHIRFFTTDDIKFNRIPAPYDQNGTGDFWYISSKITITRDGSLLESLSALPKPFNQGPDPSAAPSRDPLKGLSLFSGGGNLDRGLEDGAAVLFTHSVDIDGDAIHTQKANSRNSEQQLYWGSADDYLKAVAAGHKITAIARIGEIQIIAAGSPCPGFSSLQRNALSAGSKQKASHITTFCSAVDLYRPQYAFLENVVNMAATRLGFEEEKTLSQVVGCLVALGYQVQQFLMDAWSYGSAQRRSRIIISIAAPNVETIQAPPLTHSHPFGTPNRSLGVLSNRERFGCREFPPTPFEFTSSEHAVADLPHISAGAVQTCIPFPDHRLSSLMNEKSRAIMKRIPTVPPSQGYQEARNQGLIPVAMQVDRNHVGKAFRRIASSKQFPTITTATNAQYYITGEIVHWEEPRQISIQEARRAQGVPDHEVIVGSLNKQYEIVGNGVDRKVALVLGLRLCQACHRSENRSGKAVHILDEEDYEVVDLTSEDEVISLDSDGVPVREVITLATRDYKKAPATDTNNASALQFAAAMVLPTRSKHHDRGDRGDTHDERAAEVYQSYSNSLPSSASVSKLVGIQRKGGMSKDGRPKSDQARRSSAFSSVSSFVSVGSKRTSSESVDELANTKPEFASRKRTRHSGLRVQHDSISWDKVPERSLKKASKSRE